MAGAERATMELLAGIEPLLGRYDAFLLDQFGVLHDGAAVFEGVREALELMRRRGKITFVLSNSGKRSATNEERLRRLGVGRELYTRLLTSGETAWLGLRDGDDETFAGLGRRCLFFSRGGDLEAVADTGLRLTDDPARAGFVLLSGVDGDEAAHARCGRLLDEALARGLPLVCTNPDTVSLEGGRLVPGPGSFARRYEEEGGEVRWVGKPWPAIYRRALAEIDAAPSRIAAIGDSIDHDIRGAAAFGIDGVLVTSGVHGDRLTGDEEGLIGRAAALAEGAGCRPRWLLRRFAPERRG